MANRQIPVKPMSVDMVLEDEPPVKRIKTETATIATRTCQFCANKKQVAANCANLACKKCCLTRPQVCATHPKGRWVHYDHTFDKSKEMINIYWCNL